MELGCETFSRRGGCAINKKIPFLSGADGVVRNFKQNKGRYAGNIRTLRDFLLTTRPLRGLPSFERRGMSSLQQLSSISKLPVSGNHQLFMRTISTPRRNPWAGRAHVNV